MKGIQKIFKSPFFVSMATAAKFVQVCGSFWGVDKIQNGVAMETEVLK
jgi:hypothetical protein